MNPTPPGVPAPPVLAFAFQARVELGTAMDLGQVPRGRRLIIPIVGGTFEGPGMKGRVLDNGADWQIVREDVDPDLVYFRTVPTFETSAPELQWLTRSIFVGTGERYPSHVLIRFWRLR